MKRLLLLILATALLTPLHNYADCLNCITPHTEYFENGVTQQSYIKKCRAKQKDIDEELCPGCKCPRAAHSIHRHPYKWHNGAKLTAQPASLALKGNNNSELKNTLSAVAASLNPTQAN